MIWTFFKGVFALVLLACVAFFTGVLWPLAEVSPVAVSGSVAIKNVNVIDVHTGSVMPMQTVWIDGGRVVYVGSEENFETLDADVFIDGTDKYLMPALWDMHTHIYKISPLTDLPLFIGYGVTNVRDMLSCPVQGDPFISCPEDKRRWTEQAEAGEIISPRIQSSASFMANGPGMLKRMKNVPEFFGVATPEHARAFVRHNYGKVQEIKVYNDIQPEAYFALVEEAKKLGIPVVGHRPRGVSVLEAAKHQKSIEHARFILHESFEGSAALRARAVQGEWKENRRDMLALHDPLMASEIFAAMKEHGTWYVPTHLTRRVDAYAEAPMIREDPNLRYVHPLLKWQWLEDVNGVLNEDPSPEARQVYRDFYAKGLELTGQAHAAGVNVLVGSDYTVSAVNTHEELEQLVLAGLSPIDALRAATINPARYYHLDDQYGSVEEGKIADVILLNKNPLDNIQHTQAIEAVLFQGNYYNREKLDEILNVVEGRARSWSVGCKIVWQFILSPVNY